MVVGLVGGGGGVILSLAQYINSTINKVPTMMKPVLFIFVFFCVFQFPKTITVNKKKRGTACYSTFLKVLGKPVTQCNRQQTHAKVAREPTSPFLCNS